MFETGRTVRFLAWASAVTLAWAVCHDLAFAQGSSGTITADPPADDGFVTDIFRSIFLFDTKGLMTTLGKPQYAIASFIILNLIVFVETGLLIGFFLPGDSLLVITGLICANESCGWNMPLLLITLSASAIIGDTVGYWVGYKAGPAIFNREESFFFHKDHLLKAKEFYEKYGGITIVLARFVPFLRTFAPVVAGVGKMEYGQFVFYNVFGGIAWVFSMVLTGRYLPQVIDPMLAPFFGERFRIAEHVEKVVIFVVFLSITPMLYAWIRSKFEGPAAPPAPPAQEAIPAPEVALNAK
ncbi:MAG: DedA family protein [Planctomycetes bacterium]|nr:DedA family protein [Planctomycetota bacterium]